jgi:uncharacterized protein (DUF1015 family)
MRIRPFRGYRYRTDKPDVSAVVAPPYDQIDPETQARLHAMSPHNVVRITLPREEPGRDPYQRARETLEAWLADGTWVPDDRPAIYPYQQTFSLGGREVTRRAFVALGEVSEYARGVVRPHERTHHGPKQDRRRLLEATRADTGLLFMLVDDAAGDLAEAWNPPDEPVAEARDLRGEIHRLWRITDERVIARLVEAMVPRSVIIADGHHRYETAVEYARRHPEARHKMMAFCARQAPGLAILPNHRLVHGLRGFSLEHLARAARRWFDVAPLGDPLAFQPAPRRIGVVSADGALELRLRDDAFDAIAWPAGSSPAWRRLAVSVLHEGLLRPLLGITDEVLEAGTHVDYVADQAQAVALARQGRYQAAFLIAPTTAAELAAVVEGGELMPQKSTHFYPKMLDGLVFHRLEE